jgi:polysaccharide transporter, PST family
MGSRHLWPVRSAPAVIATTGAGPPPGADRAIVRPSLEFAAVDIVGKILSLAVVVVLARRMAEAEFGQVVASLAVANVLLAFFDFGMNFHLVALVVRDRRQVHEAIARRYQVLAAIILGALVTSALPPLRPFAVCVAAGAAMAALPTGVLLAGREPWWAACSLVGPNLLFLGLVAAVPEYDSVHAMALWTVANLATLVSLWPGVEWVRPKRDPQVGLWRLHRQSISLALFNFVVLAYGRLDTVLVAALVGSAVAGVYGTSYRVVLAAVGVASWSANVAAQRFRDAESGIDELRRLIRYAATVAVVVAGGLLLVLNPAVDFLLGRRADIPVAAVVAFAALAVPLMVANPITYFLVIRGRQRHLTTASLLVGAAALAMYPLGIAAFGMSGGAMSSLVIELLALALFARAALRAHERADAVA